LQDHKYLDVFSRMLNILASKAPSSKEAMVFTKSALSVYQVETGLHGKLLKDWGIAMEEADSAEMQPACLMYTSYMSSVVQSQPFHEGVSFEAAQGTLL
jgi:thiaminase